jgi:single-strand DNA-binding protein
MADSLNSVTLTGGLTADMELKYSTSGKPFGRFSLGTTQSRKEGDRWVEQSHYFDCVLLGRTAEALQQYLVRGKQVAIIGTLQQNRWQDRQTGQNRSRVEIKIRDIQLMGVADGRSRNNTGQRPAPAADSRPAAGQPADDGFDDDIPF